MNIFKFTRQALLYLLLWTLLGQFEWQNRTLENHFHVWVNHPAVQNNVSAFKNWTLWEQIAWSGQKTYHESVQWVSQLWQTKIQAGPNLDPSIRQQTQKLDQQAQELVNTLKQLEPGTYQPKAHWRSPQAEDLSRRHSHSE